MATFSSWRTGGGGGGGGGNAGGPRWSQGASNGSSPIPHPSSAGTNASRPVDTPAAAATAAAPSFPPLGAKGPGAAPVDTAESVQRDRMLYLLVGLVGNTVLASTRSGIKYVGILSSTTVPGVSGSSLGIVLSSAQQIVNETGRLGPLKKMLIIKGEDLDSFSAKDVGLDVPVSMSSANRAGFRTDTEISKKALESFSEGRTLQKWADDPDSMPLESEGAFGDAGGASSGGLGGWDQFAANESRFGVKSNYDETLYTTKLDKSAKDYRDREKKADQLAREIMGATTNNVHVAEERNLSGEGEEAQTEEDRFGAVVRSPNAYVPPAARRAAAVAAAAGAQSTIKANGAAREDKAANGAQPTSVAIPTITNTLAVKDGVDANNAAPHQAGPDAVGEFRQFVSSERERMEKKKAALAKKEKDTKLADLKNWGDKFKLKFPVSNEAQGPEAESEQGVTGKPRDPSLQKSMSPTTAHVQKQAKGGEEVGGTSSVMPSPHDSGMAEASVLSSDVSRARLAETKAMLAKMTIPKIPPFNPERARAKQTETAAPIASASPAALPSSKTAFKMSAKASSFKPFNPNAAAFTPGGAVAGGAPPSVSPRGAPSEASTVNSPLPTAAKASVLAGPVTPANPFFGSRVLKKTTPLDVREDFNPFKNGKVPESQTVGPTWGFTGKGHRYLFHAIPAEENQQHLAQLPPHPPTPMGPVHNMVPMALHPHGAMGQQGPPPGAAPPPPHLQQQHNQAAAVAMASNGGQPFYMPYGASQGGPGPYRFQGQQGQPMQQMPGNYGQMPPHYMPFSPPMPPTGPPVYSPQMANMFPPGANMHNMGVPPNQGPPPRNGGAGQGMQGKAPPHMYYSNPPFAPNTPGGGPPGVMSPMNRQQIGGPPPQQQQQPGHHQQHNSNAGTVHSAAASQSGSATG